MKNIDIFWNNKFKIAKNHKLSIYKLFNILAEKSVANNFVLTQKLIVDELIIYRDALQKHINSREYKDPNTAKAMAYFDYKITELEQIYEESDDDKIIILHRVLTMFRHSPEYYHALT